MGILTNPQTQTRVRLLHHTRVGRSETCDLTIRRQFISTEHASLRHQGGRWTIRDLNSSNGVTVNGAPVPERADAPLALGDRIALGQAQEVWILEDDGPPCAVAFGPHGLRREAEDEVLSLPDDAHGWARIERDNDQWCCVDGQGRRTVTDGEILVVHGEPWQLSLPDPVARTKRCSVALRRLPDLSLRIRVAQDNETFEIAFMHGDQAIVLPHRAHHELLVRLAGYLIIDRDQGKSDAAGWRDVGLVAREVGLSRQTFDTHVSRLRRQVHGLGIIGGRGIIERWDGNVGKARLSPIMVSTQPLD